MGLARGKRGPKRLNREEDGAITECRLKTLFLDEARRKFGMHEAFKRPSSKRSPGRLPCR